MQLLKTAKSGVKFSIWGFSFIYCFCTRLDKHEKWNTRGTMGLRCWLISTCWPVPSSVSQGEYMFGSADVKELWLWPALNLTTMWFIKEFEAKWKQSLQMTKVFNSLLKICDAFIRMHQTLRVYFLVFHTKCIWLRCS